MIPRWKSVARFAVLIVAGLAGCGGGDELQKYEIGGKVTLGGQPVEAGTITFVPADGEGPTAGGPITNGEYSAEVPPGPKKVQINVPKVVGQRKVYDTPDSPMVDIVQEQAPPQYNTETTLTADITQDKSDLNFDLQAGK